MISDEITRRPAREPDYAAENRGLGELADQLASHPDELLRKLAETVLELCQADSAGVSLVNPATRTCCWQVVTGEFAPDLAGSIPWDLCSCGTASQQGGALLLQNPARHFPALAGLKPPVAEFLVVPFQVEGKPAGTLWAALHTSSRRFDAEDARLLTSLARFAAAGSRFTLPLQRRESTQTGSKRAAVLEEVFRAAPSFLLVLRGPEFIFEFVNEAYYRLVGHRNLLGRPAFDALPEAAAAGYEEHISRVMTTREPFFGHELPVTLARTPGAPPEQRLIDLVYLPLLDPDGTCSRVLGHGTDVTEQVRAREKAEIALRESQARQVEAVVREQEARATESALRANEARQSYLLHLGDALRPLSNPLAIQETAARILGEYLGADHVHYGEIEGADDEVFVIHLDYCKPGVTSFVGRYRFDQFGAEMAAALRAGRSLVVADTNTVPELTAENRAIYANAGVRTYVAAPLLKEGHITAFLGVNQNVPREWSLQEVALIEETAERTWAAVERARAEVAVREAGERYERQLRLFDGVASTTPDFVYLFDLQGQFRYANRRLLEVWGMQLPDIVGKTCLELGYEPWHHDMHMREIAQVIETRQAIKGEVPFKAPLTEVFGVYEYIFTPVLGPDGEVEFIAGTTRDITEHKRAADALQESARRKDEFLATLAHELRNPLAPIVTALEVLRLRIDDPAAVHRARETIQRQVDHMRRLVDDLLDVARITRGMVGLQLERVDLGSVLTSAVQMARPLIDQRGQELTVSVPLERVCLPGDPHRLIQVLTNLLTNAAKFTPEGGQLFVIAEHRNAEVVIRVRDTGKGIPAEMLPHIFDLFTQVNPSIDRAEGGLGLGLTLVQKLVEMHGGRVEAHSPGSGLGSEFVVRLPAPLQVPLTEECAPSDHSVPASASLRILAVDDNVDAADTLAELLPLWGHQVRVAYTGPEALALAQETRPDVILLDIGLPGLDGYTIAQKIRNDAELAVIRLVAVTGFGQAEDRQRAREAGFDAHLTKPVDPDELRRLLEALQLP